MNLESEIIKSICLYPSLYYYSDLGYSRFRVLDHTFLTLGNGVDIENGKLKRSERKKAKIRHEYGRKYTIKELTKKIKDKETIVEVYNLDTKETKLFFQSELPEKLPPGEVGHYPRDNDEFIKSYGAPVKRPYPFCMFYLPFVEINPNYKKYNDNNIRNITVEELSESKPLIRKDLVKGIVEVTTDALNFFISDEWEKDRYYNFASKSDPEWIKKFDANKNRVKDYDLPTEMSEASGEEVLKFLANRRRQWYIADCKKIIEAFS